MAGIRETFEHDVRAEDIEPGGAALRELVMEALRSQEFFTNILIQSNEPIAWRRPLGMFPIKSDEISGMVTKPMIIGFLDLLRKDWRDLIDADPFDMSIYIDGSMVRLNISKDNEGKSISISIRRHPKNPIKFSDLNLSSHAKKMIEWTSKGLVLISGATNSGKTTTINSIINHFNTYEPEGKAPKRANIITIEDPIEYEHKNKFCIITSKSVPQDVSSFSVGLKSAMRQNPDIIVIGEVRDMETAEIMMLAARSGHLVFATLHADSAVGTIEQLVKFFPESMSHHVLSSLANSLVCVSCQSIIPNARGDGIETVSETLMNNKEVFGYISSGNLIGLQDAINKNQNFEPSNPNAQPVSQMASILKLVKEGKILPEHAVKASYRPMETMEEIRKQMSSK